jgi:Domain of unknown function (DUF2341)
MILRSIFIQFIFLLLGTGIVSAQAFLRDWKYRQVIVLDGSGASESVADAQVELKFSMIEWIKKGKMHPTGRDLRICDEDGISLLCFWVENEVFADTTKIWVKVPELRAFSKKRIFIYFGNPKAEAQANAECTFLAFDDFNQADLDTAKWEQLGTGQIQIYSGKAHLQANEADIAIRSRESFAMPIIVEMNVVESVGKYMALALIKDIGTNVFWEGYTMSLNQSQARMELNLTQTEVSPCGAYDVLPTFVRAKPAQKTTGIWSLAWITRNTIMAHWAGGDLLEPNSIWKIQQLNVVLGVLACNTNQAFAGKLVVDWVRIRKFLQNPPMVHLDITESNPSIPAPDFGENSIG